MWPSVSSAMWAGWLCLLLPAVLVRSEENIYGELGGEVSLRPPSVTEPINSITWRVGKDIAVDWDTGENITYNQFKGRGHLNTLTGVMTIRELTLADSGTYTPEINSVSYIPIQLAVIPGVPDPTVTHSCDEEMTTCRLTCGGDTTGAGPITYTWMSDGNVKQDSSHKDHIVVKKDSLNIKEFSCAIKNPVSSKSSQPFANPFTSSGELKISKALTVFICLLFAVLLVVAVHRVKAGEWFFQKGSMPWEADFWQKPSSTREAAEANGTTTTQQKGTVDEETQMN